jgi:hypothetical protein
MVLAADQDQLNLIMTIHKKKSSNHLYLYRENPLPNSLNMSSSHIHISFFLLRSYDQS